MANRGDVIERIKKLLALAEDEGATEAEATAAALMAQRLIAQNDVEQWSCTRQPRSPSKRATPRLHAAGGVGGSRT